MFFSPLEEKIINLIYPGISFFVVTISGGAIVTNDFITSISHAPPLSSSTVISIHNYKNQGEIYG